MKLALALLSGFILTLGMFAGGFATAAALLWIDVPDQPVIGSDTSEVWTTDALVVDSGNQQFERVAARLSPHVQGAAKAPVDHTTTASIGQDEAQSGMDYAVHSERHVSWCSRRFRSYDRLDNSYTSYSGARRECVSPYMDEMSASVDASRREEFELASSSDTIAYPGDDHIQACMERYRSYRPEDNSYQPYGYGPRQQCE